MTKKSQGSETKVKNAENQAPPKLPPLTINAQYIKDLSFEHPNPLESLKPADTQPEIDINIDVDAEELNHNTYEVILKIKANAKRNKSTMFISEVVYAGIFTLGDGIHKEAVHPVLMIECPRILFPFARSILANITREGGFPPLSLNPIDFAGLYQQQLQAAKNGK